MALTSGVIREGGGVDRSGCSAQAGASGAWGGRLQWATRPEGVGGHAAQQAMRAEGRGGMPSQATALGATDP